MLLPFRYTQVKQKLKVTNFASTGPRLGEILEATGARCSAMDITTRHALVVRFNILDTWGTCLRCSYNTPLE